jgi:hypothetical protein
MTQNTHAYGSSFTHLPLNINSFDNGPKSPSDVNGGKIPPNPLERTMSPTQAYPLSAQGNVRRAASNDRDLRREFLNQKYTQILEEVQPHSHKQKQQHSDA